jgi:hypothetical protein
LVYEGAEKSRGNGSERMEGGKMGNGGKMRKRRLRIRRDVDRSGTVG